MLQQLSMTNCFTFYPTFLPKGKITLMRSPSCLCVCVSISPYQLLNQFVDFYEIRYGDHAIEVDLIGIIFNTVT
jgi:hypothetical protein